MPGRDGKPRPRLISLTPARETVLSRSPILHHLGLRRFSIEGIAVLC